MISWVIFLCEGFQYKKHKLLERCVCVYNLNLFHSLSLSLSSISISIISLYLHLYLSLSLSLALALVQPHCFSTGDNLTLSPPASSPTPRVYLAMSAAIFGCHYLAVLLALREQRPGILLNILQCTGQPPDNDLSDQNVTSTEVKKPCTFPSQNRLPAVGFTLGESCPRWSLYGMLTPFYFLLFRLSSLPSSPWNLYLL